jgi:hypothetical protein
LRDQEAREDIMHLARCWFKRTWLRQAGYPPVGEDQPLAGRESITGVPAALPARDEMPR